MATEYYVAAPQKRERRVPWSDFDKDEAYMKQHHKAIEVPAGIHFITEDIRNDFIRRLRDLQ